MHSPPQQPARAFICGLVAIVALAAAPAGSFQSDLDAFMQRVVARRDDNWKKLQQYILDEREEIELRGPGRVSLWGERRDYTWYIRDGLFIRSPVKANGVTVGEADRRNYEEDFVRREQRRAQREAQRERRRVAGSDAANVDAPAANGAARHAEPDALPGEIDALIREGFQPQFISSAYFLRFKFDAGRYALVGREMLEGRSVLRIEYYPTKLFSDEPGRRREKPDELDAVFQRLMNKTSLVTLWIDPGSHQILKYTFDNVDLDFLPAQWMVRVDDMRASMTMGQMFPEVWLPRALEIRISMSLAVGQFDVRYGLDYHDYRRAEVTSKVGIPGGR